ncbi:hypothetical protein [Eubacterium callanderi]|uniref:Uncharacterized protein n=1 Tax=Eubacterium callanderi TaxID=53442 RepID=A0A853JRT1_9FIRM|nr:hypothetical protein [Eubacterium callanderi]
MNYLTELLAFNHWLSTHPMPGLLQAYSCILTTKAPCPMCPASGTGL